MQMRTSGEPRIVLYCVEPGAYRLLRGWAERHGYTFRLIVTTPGPKRARDSMYRQIIAEAPPGQDILVTTSMRRVAPLLASLEPDLILSFTLPYRIPPEVIAVPRHGAVNLHPAPLPAYRGPNPARMIYNGEPILGVTLHRIAVDYDTGPILSSRVAPMPEDVVPSSIQSVWDELALQVLDEGVARALADEPGTAQDSTQASYAASFTPEELWLEWGVPSLTLQRRATALNLSAPQARAWINGKAYLVEALTALPDTGARVQPGSVLEQSEHSAMVQTLDGRAYLSLRPLP